MKRKSGESPFNDFWVYGPILHKTEGRYFVYLVNKKTGEKTSTSLARYKMSIHLGRILTNNEFVDHIDENKKNDSLENLQILTRKENNEKSRLHRKTKKQMVKLCCPGCGCEFERERRQTHLSKNNVFTTCSRSCGGKVRALLQHGKLSVEEIISSNILEEFEISGL